MVLLIFRTDHTSFTSYTMNCMYVSCASVCLLFPAAEADSAGGRQPDSGPPHPVQPDAAHGQLRRLLPIRTKSALVPQLSNQHAGRTRKDTCCYTGGKASA